MTQNVQLAVKRAVEDEFGITIDDPDELRRYVESKMSEMNALDRASFEMRVGRFLDQNERGERPRTRNIIVIWAILTLVAWLLWRPLGAVLAISACGNVRKFAIRHAPFWTPPIALLFGALHGIFVAVVVRIGTVLAIQTRLGSAFLGFLGLAAAAYVGYGVPRERHALAAADERRVLAQIAAVACYLLVLGSLVYTGVGR